MSMISPYPQARDNPGLAWAAQEEAAALLKLKLAIEAAYNACKTASDNLSGHDARMLVATARTDLYSLMSDLQNEADDALARADKFGG